MEKVKVRKHRGGYQESIATIKEVNADLKSIFDYFMTDYDDCIKKKYKPSDIRFKTFKGIDCFDKHKEWNDESIMVCIDDFGVLGMINREIVI